MVLKIKQNEIIIICNFMRLLNSITINFELIMKKHSLLLFVVLLLFIPFHRVRASLPQAEQDSTASVAPQPIELIDINYEMERVEKKFTKFEYKLEPDARFYEIDSIFNDYKTFLEQEAKSFKSYNPYNLSKYFLESTYRSWEGFYLKLSDWQSEINGRTQEALDNIDELDKIRQTWVLTLESEELTEEAEDSKNRVNEIIERADSIRKELKKQKRQYIVLEDDITDMTAFCTEITEEVLLLQQHLQDSLFVAVSPPIWKVKITPSDYLPVNDKLNKARRENAKTLKNYFETKSMGSLWVAGLMIIIFIILLRYRYSKLIIDDNEPGHKSIARILIKQPILTTISLILVAFHLLFPYHPLLIGHIITMGLLINMRFILSEFIDRTDRLFILKIILLLLVNDLEIIFWYFGKVANYYVLFETVVGVALMINYLKPVYWQKFKTSAPVNKAGFLLALQTFIFYFVSFIANFFGYLDLSVLLVKAGVHVPVSTIILFGLYKITVTIIETLIHIGKTRKTNVLANYWNIIEKRTLQITRFLLIYYWLFSIAVSFEVSRTIFDSISEFFLKERSIGTLNITIGGIFALILILLITYIISKLLKFIIEDVLLKNSNLPRGVPATISVTIRYFLVILGFTFALSAAGIDLGKFGLLAGALGVGIGFGLQNIVNNFISGLILVYERPLSVDDTIEVENLLGKVKRIGIRSSNVRTYDGAEVVVPNGNLISNQLINWTLSDNKRRIEIKVGTSYGSDPNEVLKILEKVAMENEDTLKEPPPRALFEDFGDSSLNFRLLFWVPYDIGIGTKSDVSVGIFNTFKENNIEIPFPQVDLHVKKEIDKSISQEPKK